MCFFFIIIPVFSENVSCYKTYGIVAFLCFPMFSYSTEKVPVDEILLELSRKISTQRQCKFNINHGAIWDGAKRGFQRVSYDPTYTMCVRFSDDMGKTEEGVDLGGPRREFLRLLMDTITMSYMFEGKDNRKNLALDSTGNNLL